MDLGKAVKKARGKYFTQEEIAQMTGVTNIYVSLVENNKRLPCLNWVIKFGMAVNVPVPVLFYLAMDEYDATDGMEAEYMVMKPLIDEYMALCFGVTI
jgi:transcriptional regulator with XRE-family HTH domain